MNNLFLSFAIFLLRAILLYWVRYMLGSGKLSISFNVSVLYHINVFTVHMFVCAYVYVCVFIYEQLLVSVSDYTSYAFISL